MGMNSGIKCAQRYHKSMIADIGKMLGFGANGQERYIISAMIADVGKINVGVQS